MSVREKTKHILVELSSHIPFTIFGAFLGIVFMLLFRAVSETGGKGLFAVFHPCHVVLSAMVTASLFKLHKKASGFFLVLVIGYFGSVGIATLSDSVIPYLGERMLGLHVPAHHNIHRIDSHERQEHKDTDEQGVKIHLGFIEQWYIVNPAAVLGVVIGFFLPRTKFPHAGHVLISTWASSSHVLMNTQGEINFAVAAGLFVVLFVAVWIPCCVSDIILPLLFVKPDWEISHHGR